MARLFVDLDGVLADFDEGYRQLFGEYPARRFDPNTTAEDLPEMWERINAHGSFYRDLPLMPDAKVLWDYLQPRRPIVLTGIPHSVARVAEHKRDWVWAHLDSDAEVITCKSKDKRNYCEPGDILIDDWPKYRHLWEARGGVFILHTNAAASIAALEAL
jgi:5'(3')-deoxyribonucleotidase